MSDAVKDTVRRDVEDLYSAYSESLDGNDSLHLWPELFTENCLYKIVPRANYERGLPYAIWVSESRGMLKDRVAALGHTTFFETRWMRHMVSGLRVEAGADGAIVARSSYLVLETLSGQCTRVFNTGRYFDKMVYEEGILRFAEKICVYDSSLIPNSLVYPL